jgi:hypothetical protein
MAGNETTIHAINAAMTVTPVSRSAIAAAECSLTHFGSGTNSGSSET